MRRFGIPALLFFVCIYFPYAYGAHSKEAERLKRKLMRATDSAYVEKIFADPRCKMDSSLFTRKNLHIDFYDSVSIARGKEFLKTHKGFLDTLSKSFGPPPAIIVAIHRFETNFGSYRGDYRVFQTLYTRYLIARSAKKKADIVRELACFVRYAKEHRWDALAIPSSWKGAAFIPQLMPRSYRYAVDWDGDGIINLWQERDGLASIANNLVVRGWGKSKTSQARALRRYNRGPYGRKVLKYMRLITH